MASKRKPPRRDGQKKARPTDADKTAARRLLALWQSIPISERPSQEEIGAEFPPSKPEDDGGISQSAVSQYLHGNIPLNFLAVLIFASKLRCDTADIREDLPEFDLLRRAGWGPTRERGATRPDTSSTSEEAEAAHLARSNLSAEEQQIISCYREAQDAGKRAIVGAAAAAANRPFEPPAKPSRRRASRGS